MSKPADASLQVIARAPFEIYYEGPATVVSAANQVGNFDVLPGHADFFSMLLPGEVTIDTGSESLSFMINTGIITVQDNRVRLFVNM